MRRKNSNAKSQLQGYALYIRFHESCGYERQGHLFVTRYEAGQYRFRHFPQASAWRITGVRVDPRPGTDHYPDLTVVGTPTKGSAA